jgi:hypothetical protein
MARHSKSSLIPHALLLLSFFTALFIVHLTVDSEIGREIADGSILFAFFAILLLWTGRK